MLEDVTYTLDMFHKDQDEINAKLASTGVRLDNAGNSGHPLLSFEDILDMFKTRYGNTRGSDYCTRFFAVLRFIDHYHKELVLEGLLTEKDAGSIQASSELINILLGSFKTPQPPRKLAASALMNKDHEFNYPKVLKAVKPKPK